MKTAIMFSGQGAQKVGMGKEFFDNFEVCRQVFEEADDTLGFSVQKLCFEPGELLNQTAYAQPAILTASIAAYRYLECQGVAPDVLMGLSLGEYSALVADGAIGFAEAVALVHKRGQLMAEFAKPGGMIAAIGLTKQILEEICEAAKPAGFAACANFNTPEQIAIAGEQAALDACAAAIKQAGGKVMPLKVSGPFHTLLLSEAAERFREYLTTISINSVKSTIISNLTALPINANDDVRDHLARHMVSPVRWVESVQHAISLGCGTFIEVGCGKTLVNFVKKIDESVDAFATESIADLKARGFCND